MRSAAILCALALLGCKAGDAGDDDVPIDAFDDGQVDVYEPPPCSPVIGDLSQPIEVVPLTVVRHTNQEAELHDGDDLPLIPPFQGGFILLLGGKVRNLDGCNAQVTASLRDPTSGQVVGLEQRPSALLIGDDGWGHPWGTLEYTLANVAVCPNFASTRDVQDQPWQVEVRYETPDGRSATVTRAVTPRCEPGDVDCVCMCDADFTGGCELVDGGPLPDLTDAGAD